MKYLWYAYISAALMLLGLRVSRCCTSACMLVASLRKASYPPSGQFSASRGVRFCVSRCLAYFAVASFMASCHALSFLSYAPSAFTPAIAKRLYWLIGLLLILLKSFFVNHLA